MIRPMMMGMNIAWRRYFGDITGSGQITNNGLLPARSELALGKVALVHLLLPTMIKTPVSRGSRQSKASRSMPKSFSLGETALWVIHAARLSAAWVCGSATCATARMAASNACRRSTTACSRSLQ
jgi:hypothetical protein